MDELIEDFLVETSEGLEELDNDLVVLEQNPADKEIIAKIFRVMHTIKGTCGFLGLARLEKIAHAGEDVFDRIRGGDFNVTPEIISLVFESLDKIKEIMSHIEQHEVEPEGDDSDLTARLRACAESGGIAAATLPVEPPVVQESIPTESNGIPQDNEELQRLFDETQPLVDMGNNKAVEVESGKSDAIPQDSDELQRLFDETQPLVDMGTKEPVEKQTVEAVKSESKDKNDDKVKKAVHQSIRVNLDILEDLMQKASELVLTRNQLMQIMRQQQDSAFNLALQRLNGITTEIQESVMKTRMQPVGNAWTKLPRIIRDLSVELGKKIELKMTGEDTELDRHLLEAITDPLTHMIRNSADHGIERPETRVAAGKVEYGTIELKAYQGGGYIIMEISDDGKGIDPEVIKNKAVEKGLVSEDDAKNMSDSQILQFIFAAGLSTAEKVTSVSGRGVGMDVVKNNIENISGTVSLESVKGKGSTFTIKIPLTLAIMPILQVAVKKQKFAIPQINVIEIVKVNGKSSIRIENINNKPILRLRGKLLPLVSLSEVLGYEEYQADDETQNNTLSEFVTVCEIGKYNFGIIVEEVFETEEIVVKPVSPILKHIEVYSGCTILGDGSVIMILDPNGLAKSIGEVPQGNDGGAEDDRADKTAGEESSFIVFRVGDKTPKVIPLELISRLEEIDVKKIEYSRGMPIIQYRGDLMRIVKIDKNYNIPEEGTQEMLVLSDYDKVMGLVVEEIIDIAKCRISSRMSGGNGGYMGSVVINDKTCDVIDVGYFFKEAFSDIDESRKSRIATTNHSKILFVDDSPFFRKFVPPELNAAGFDVTVCTNAKEAYAILEANPAFDAVVTDINMPGMNGDELTMLCKEDERFKSLPFIAMSSQIEDGSDNSKFAYAGFDACVPKTNHKAIIDVLGSILKKEAA
ncbi:MAG: chemotaxis protein CheW [Rickettsiales bacterium]|nr:chemotaxis protein CheW [Pseudomonadota bacterium]MDA0966536.1 chemotaxis protein CheW [Pseudomonadota bacterium]MDG4543398.1 chemotaxis protein CheW [Rickettsiales bacterium]MDG4546640.1 chemotaxis protein CheW [Rickettsiales bacterium]MDG4548113.1 chemotaxis protein CheW [Rickettsiales bacterium]